MKILVYSRSAWDNKKSSGNTFSNWFDGKQWNSDNFSSIYNRNKLPDNNLSVNYYRLTSIDIVKGFIKGKIKGKKFSSKDIDLIAANQKGADEVEDARIDRIHKNKTKWIYFFNDLIWMSKIWRNKYFSDFVKEQSPDIFFSFARFPAALWPMISYIKKNMNCKIVLFIADDIITQYDKYNIIRRGYSKRLLKKSIDSADKLYAVSDEMSQKYKELFGKEVITLYKGCDLNNNQKSTLNNPLRFVYAGNLLYGRDDTLSLVAKAIAKHNLNGTKATLEIYSGTTITPELENELNIPHSSKLMGPRPYEEIKKIMNNADVVLHVESFKKNAIEIVKYSLSTKIIDCLQSSAQVLGIGPKDIASIEYLKNVDGAKVVCDISMLDKTLEDIISNKDNILKNASMTRKYALSHHEISMVQHKLREDFLNLIG